MHPGACFCCRVQRIAFSPVMPLSGQTVRLQATPVYVNKHGDVFLIGLQLTNDRTEDWHSFQTFVRYVESEND